MSDWKNNPAIAAIAAGSIVLTTTLLVVYNYVLPVYQLADRNTIAELKLDKAHQNEKNQKQQNEFKQIGLANKARIDSLTSENEQLTKEIKNLKSNILKLSLSSFFQKNSSLPFGYSKVTPGMHIGDVYNYYEKPRILTSESGSYLKIILNTAGIGDITYYAGDDERPDLITHIFVNKYTRYFTHSEEDRELISSIEKLSLLDFLSENLGTPEKCGAKSYIWHSEKSPYYTFFTSDEDDSYSIWLIGGYKPGIDTECRKTIINLKA